VISPLSIPAHEHFTAALAELICMDSAEQLPDLSHVHVFIPNALAARQLRRQLVQTSHAALIGPYIGPMQQWLRQQIPLQQIELTPINQQARRLLLIDALNQHSDLFQGSSSWQVCDSLLALFDELSRYNGDLLDSSEQAWIECLRQAYGLESDSLKLNREAKIVYTLWRAWHQQLRDMGITDSCNAYLQRLNNSEADITGQRFYLVGADSLTGMEQAWCERLQQHNRLTFIELDLQDEATSPGPYAPVYDQTRPLLERIQAFAAVNNNEHVEPPLQLFAASNGEQQAAAIDVQTRQWLLQQKNSIAIVTEDRKLARRVRALLERAGVRIQDTAGWSLSTTSAATCVERWLECIEQDFAHQPLLDLLKSPFFIGDDAREQHLNQVFRLQQDIIHHENIPSDIRRYQAALKHRHQRLAHWSAQAYDNINQLLELLQQQAADLLEAYLHDRPRPAGHYLAALLNSLQQLGIRQRLTDDPAGQRILQVLAGMQRSLDIANPQMNWSDFRTWLASSLEQEQFTPQDQPSSVYLMNLQQAQYCHFDALIIAGANKTSLPGSSSQTAFFNHRVKRALGLDNWSDDKQASYVLFRQFLHAAEQILISYTAEQDGEWIQPSPWVSSLADFYRLATGQDLQSRWLQQYFHYSGQRDQQTPSLPLEKHPGTPLAPELVPQQYSASRYQRLINCPYQFFAADGLSLKPEEEVTRELQKSEYGEKVHLILYAFHSPVKHLPAPFSQPVSAANRDAALQHLVALSKTVFASNMEDNVQHRGWLQRWLETTEAYIDWLIQRQRDWSIHELEQNLEVAIDTHTTIKGRLDRIDTNQNSYAIIDYKTGSTASQQRVDSGEDVQLVSYAKLLDPVREVAYLKLDKGEVKITASLRDEQLDEIKQQSLQRLQSITQAIREGHKLHAWGDRDACRYCDMQGLCRKQIWENL
jgi:ATP-dependent helicase/nuclease subunit B